MLGTIFGQEVSLKEEVSPQEFLVNFLTKNFFSRFLYIFQPWNILLGRIFSRKILG